MTILDQIVERTRARLEEEPMEVKDTRRAAIEISARRQPHAFAARLLRDSINIIAEIKAASPSAGPIAPNPDVEAIARAYAEGGAAAISVVTEPEFFQGSRQWIPRAADASGLPVIMKDFIVRGAQLMQGVAAGADAVLLIAALLDSKEIRGAIQTLDRYGCDALVEVHDEEEVDRALEGGARLIGVNNRDLRTFAVDLATSERLARRIPDEIIKVAESGITSPADVRRLSDAGFKAFLVGESLLRQNDRAAAVRRLCAGGREQ